MSPTRTSPDGCYRLDWQRKEVGRIAVSSGATTVKGWRAAMALCDALYARDELDVLRALKARRVTMKEVSAAEKAKAFKRGDSLRTLVLRRPLWDAVASWLPPKTDIGVTRDRYRTSFDKLKREGGLKEDVTVADLESFDWQVFKDSGRFKSTADWMSLRRAVGRFLTVMLENKHHPARFAIMSKIPRAKVRARKVSVGAAEFWKLIEKANSVIQAGLVTLAVTGMRLAEYERALPEHLTTRGDGSLSLDVQGSKTDGATATVVVAKSLADWVRAGIPMPRERQQFRKRFHEAAEAIGRPELNLHDLRHCTALFALEGGAQINEVREQMRHEDTSQTLNYARTGNASAAAAAIGRALGGKGRLRKQG